MKRLLVPFLIALLAAVASAQQLLPDNLPACAKQCTVLQQGSTGCLPAGGAVSLMIGPSLPFWRTFLLLNRRWPSRLDLADSSSSLNQIRAPINHASVNQHSSLNSIPIPRLRCAVVAPLATCKPFRIGTRTSAERAEPLCLAAITIRPITHKQLRLLQMQQAKSLPVLARRSRRSRILTPRRRNRRAHGIHRL